MKRIIKIWLITMAALGILGVLLMVSGRVLGGTYWEALRISSFGSFWDYEDWRSTEVIEYNEDHWDDDWNNGWNHHSARHCGSSSKSLNTGISDTPAQTDSIRSLDLEISGVEELVIQRGEGFGLSTEEIGHRVESYVDEGVWHIENEKHAPYGRIVLTLPKGQVFEKIELQLNGGVLNADGLDAVKIELDMAGVSADLQNLNCKTLDVDMTAGEMEIQGNVSQKTDINIVAGTFLLTMPRPEDYTYNIPTGIGTVSLDGRTFEGFGGMQSHGGTGPHFEIECAAGTVDVVFEDQ